MVSFQRFHSLGEICRGLESMMCGSVRAYFDVRYVLIYFAGHPLRPIRKKNQKRQKIECAPRKENYWQLTLLCKATYLYRRAENALARNPTQPHNQI
jgi:hypothetical protein